MSEVQINKLAELITEDLFEVGDELGSPCTRMAFISEDICGHEQQMGGLCKEAMTRYIKESIEAHLVIISIK